MGSLTGVVASKSVTEASKGALRPFGNRPLSVMAKGRLTGRLTSRSGRKLEHSDPVFPYGRDIAQRIKGTPGITGGQTSGLPVVPPGALLGIHVWFG